MTNFASLTVALLQAAAITIPRQPQDLVTLHVGQRVFIYATANDPAAVCPSYAVYERSSGKSLGHSCLVMTRTRSATVVGWLISKAQSPIHSALVRVKGLDLAGVVLIHDLIPVLPAGLDVEFGCSCCKTVLKTAKVIRQQPTAVNDLIVRFGGGRQAAVKSYDAMLLDRTPIVVWSSEELAEYKRGCHH